LLDVFAQRRGRGYVEWLFQTKVKHLRLRPPHWNGGASRSIRCCSINLHHFGVIVHMNTKMILAALALSLSLAACAKKEEAPADAAAPAAEAPAAEAPAAEVAPPADAAVPAEAPADAATAPAGETTPPPAQ
jgi:hypothetical protein